MIVPDHAHLPQSIAEWEALVEAVGEATDDTRAEKTWLELKGPLALGNAEGKFTVAKASKAPFDGVEIHEDARVRDTVTQLQLEQARRARHPHAGS